MDGIFKDSRNAYIFFIFLAITFLAIASKGLVTAQPGDENVYYYMGKLVSEGRIPYKDFFYAHPPLQIYLFALIYKMFGFKVLIFKSVPLISTLVSAFFVFKIAEEKFGNREAVIASLLFLFSYSTMFNSVFSFGVETATAFLVAGAYFLLCKNRHYFAGIFFAAAALSRLLAVIPILIILAFALFSGRKNLRAAAAFASVFLVANIAFISFFGNAYFDDAYRFHLLKSPGAAENIAEYINVIKLNPFIFLAPLLFIFAKGKKRIALFIAASAVYLVFLLSLKRIFGFYFLAAFPFLALAGSYCIVDLMTRINFSKKFRVFLMMSLSLVFIWNLSADVMFLEKNGFTGFQRGPDLIEFINSQPKDEILFGDASVVPLLAFLTGREIALDFVDTNAQVFISGMKNIDKTLNGLKGSSVLFITRSRETMSSIKEVRDFLNGNCNFLSEFSAGIEGSYIIYRCR